MSDWTSKLCAHVGIHAEYRGFDGQTIKVSPETQCAVLRAMGLRVESDAEAKDVLDAMLAEEAARPLPQEIILEAGLATDFALAHPATWSLASEDGSAVLASGQGVQHLSLPCLPIGIHKLSLKTASREFTTWVLVRPERAVQLEDHIPEARIWGCTTALYGLCDGAKAPIGSYDLLGRYAAETAQYGADFLGINPVHAMGQVRPDDVISPYSPSHRAFLNTWHCADHNANEGDASDLVDYPAALARNTRALSEQYASFEALPESAADKEAFKGFVSREGAALEDYALFEVLAINFGADWRDWPTRYRDHEAEALAAFAAKNCDAIERIKWAQWQAEVQLGHAQQSAQSAGMRVGLYLDLAVGPRLGGAETWEKNTPLVTGATLGAPPDPLGPNGQSWGLAPLSPLKCRVEGYAGFSRLLRSIMRHAGMIRIDHVLGLMRSFWIPDGGTEGAYVSYPLDALLAVVTIESARNNAVVVGEDLGLVPEGLREKLAASGIYGLDVLQYMRTPTGGFVDPKDTREMAVCTFATHDTPTVAGFFKAEDARVRLDFGGIDQDTFAQTRADRHRALETLKTSDPVAAIHRRLAKAKARMVAVQLDDIAERASQHNLPGTVDSYPNWQLKSPFTLADIRASDAFTDLGNDMRAQGRSNLKRMEQENDLSDCTDHAN